MCKLPHLISILPVLKNRHMHCSTVNYSYDGKILNTEIQLVFPKLVYCKVINV